MHYPREQVYIVDFGEPIGEFSNFVNDPENELPVIDVDVVLGHLCLAFSEKDVHQSIQQLCVKLSSHDWLIEPCAWVTKNEEEETRKCIYDSLFRLGYGLYRQLVLTGMYTTNTETYIFRKLINDKVYAFTRVP